MDIFLSYILIAFSPSFDAGEPARKVIEYMQNTVEPVIKHGADWGLKAGLAVSGIQAFVIVVKKFMDV